MSENSIRTLVSFVLISYNQEKFIREAVQSALAQTYEPLEIIISDDCSTDKTFEIITEEVNNYSGSHIVQAIRNDKNLGLIKNFEKAVSLAKGEFLVVQAGDDISMPHRTEMLVKAWQAEPKVSLVYSDAYLIDENGLILQETFSAVTPSNLSLKNVISYGYGRVIGCVAAYDADLFKGFPSIVESVFQEDEILTFRALLKNGVRSVPDKLLKYRKHNNNVYTQSPSRKFKIAHIKSMHGMALERLRSWDLCCHNEPYLRNNLVKYERLRFYRAECLDKNIVEVFKLMLKGLMDGLTVRNALGLLRLNLNI